MGSREHRRTPLSRIVAVRLWASCLITSPFYDCGLPCCVFLIFWMACGALHQQFLTKGRQDFPPCDYISWLLCHPDLLAWGGHTPGFPRSPGAVWGWPVVGPSCPLDAEATLALSPPPEASAGAQGHRCPRAQSHWRTAPRRPSPSRCIRHLPSSQALVPAVWRGRRIPAPPRPVSRFLGVQSPPGRQRAHKAFSSP